MQIPTISTARLKMRAPIEADTPHYVAFYADAGASKFYGGPLSPVAAWNKLASDLGHWQLRGYGIWMIDFSEMGGCVGGCGLYWPTGWPRPELTWWILPHARRKGIAAEAPRAAMDWAFANGWAEVQTHMRDENLPARRLVEALGGQKRCREEFPDGVKRDVFFF